MILMFTYLSSCSRMILPAISTSASSFSTALSCCARAKGDNAKSLWISGSALQLHCRVCCECELQIRVPFKETPKFGRDMFCVWRKDIFWAIGCLCEVRFGIRGCLCFAVLLSWFMLVVAGTIASNQQITCFIYELRTKFGTWQRDIVK